MKCLNLYTKHVKQHEISLNKQKHFLISAVYMPCSICLHGPIAMYFCGKAPIMQVYLYSVLSLKIDSDQKLHT